MPRSIPTLCGSLAGTPFTFNVVVHNAPYRALELYTGSPAVPFDVMSSALLAEIAGVG